MATRKAVASKLPFVVPVAIGADDNGIVEDSRDLFNGDREVVASVYGNAIYSARDRAAYIATATNSHAALVQASKYLAVNGGAMQDLIRNLSGEPGTLKALSEMFATAYGLAKDGYKLAGQGE